MQAISVSCPNCGAGLGAPEAGQYLCAYCGHRSVPSPALLDAQRGATLAAALQQFDERRQRALGQREEVRRRMRDAKSAQRRVNGYVMLGVGGLFLVIALGCFVGAAASARLDVGAFGLFWLALGGIFFYVGLRYMRSDRRERRLREHGLRGRAAVLSYKETHLVVDGNTRFDLVLRVEVPGRAPWDVRQADYVPNPYAVTNGADLPVLVDPANQNDVMVDWYAA